ncbi:hypothetical protein C7B62_14215 [Pleurocapsa sp. CCALA 161]|uniref:beta strand repeat-containing protein n=1 Tax=Pleurocapsa sp. CCALA 161 TaxID=2107688 RepID=UPI000D04B2E0|nr:DUF11 domain-containing protein [Pleurocapsa sp. CCALA 161]PSB09164.1 hypothetical protein C7B62_14215 [Pleurocapsa sp. CCALA 161]
MNNQLSIQRKASFHFGLILFASLGFTLPALSEGSQQLGNGSQGLNVYLFEYNATNNFVQANQGPRPIKVNVENANQVINISLCGWNTADVLAVEVFRPSGTEIDYTTQVPADSPGAFNATAADGAGAWRLATGNARTTTQTTLCTNQGKPTQPTGTLSTPIRFVAPEAGTYEIRLYNDSLAANNTDNVLTYFDVTVTPNASTNPDPRANNGQVWATSWAFNAGNTFEATGAYDADLYIRTPGGRTNTEFIWQLDLNKFAPQRHEIIANAIGLNAPNSRGSSPGPAGTGRAYTKSYPIYLSPPNLSSFVAPILPEPAPASVSNLNFVDNAGQDNTISPTSTSSVQDSGFFRFNSDVAGTYKITIDTDQNGVFGAGDRVLFGSATSGANAVAWDGQGDNNAVLNAGSYPVQISVGLGEYHFVTYDAETSGGGTNDGLSIWKWNGSSRSAVSNFWDDTKITNPTGATKNLVGGLSGTAAGTHTWGNFAMGSIGDGNYIDTWVFGTPQLQTTKAIIATSDANDFADAPDTYGTNKDITVGGIPASHLVNPNLHLGVNAPDSDADGQPSVNADSDDINGTTPDDEDGVISFSPLIENATTYSVTVKVKNTTGAAASLGGWIDFNKDGQFQPSEGVVQSVPNNTNSDVTLTWNNLSGLVVGDIYARFRLNSDPLTTSDFQGGGRDGEIEDYKLAIKEVDYGDAPSSFGDASHEIFATPTVYLGAIKPDKEVGTQLGNDAGAAAVGDDGNGTPDDEDAFTTLPNVPSLGSYSLNVPVTNTSGNNANLHAWVDFNKNGKFELGEYKSATVASGSTSGSLNWTVPTGTLPGNTHVRFRLTTDNTLTDNAGTTNIDERSIGVANDGEVEDYSTSISIYDYGDAPDTGIGTATGNYQTKANDNGAAQVVINTAGLVLSLGSNIDVDDGSLQNSTADADDTTSTASIDDEDGVSSFPTLTTTANQTYTVPVSVRNNVPSVNAYLVGYIDFNKDGDFNDTREKSATVTVPTSNTNPRTVNVTFTTPAGMTTGNTYARFRLGSVQATVESATGASAGTDNGEIEDYQIAIAPDGNRPLGTPLSCDSTFYITIGAGNGAAQDLYSVNRSGSNYTFNRIGLNTSTASGYPNTFSYNALAYNPANNYLYGFVTNSSATSGPYATGNVVQIGSDGILHSIGKPTNGSGGTLAITNYFAATMLADGTYVIGQNGNIAKLNVNTSPPTILSTGSLSGVSFTDFAVDPKDPTSLSGGRIYGIDETSDRLVILNVAGNNPTIISQATNPTGFNHNTGSQFVDSFGTLYYRSNTDNNLYRVDSDSTSPNYGRATSITNAPSGGNHDGASCLFSSVMQKDVQDLNGNKITTSPAGEVVKYVYSIASGNVQNLTGVTFQDDLRTVSSGNPINGTFNGNYTVSNGSGTVSFSNNNQTIQISNLVIPAQTQATIGADKLTITAEVNVSKTLTPGEYFNQASITNLPATYPASIASDYPTSPAYEDPTPLQVTAPIPSDPNLLLVKRITAINPGQSDPIQFNNFVDDTGTTNDNNSKWPDSDSNPNNNTNDYLRGAISVPQIKPGDEVEYTIYFLSNGDVAAKNVTICDVVPDNMTFVANSYAANFGMALLNGTALSTTTTKNLSNAIGDDEGDFYPLGTNPAVANLCKKHDTTNNLIPLTSSNNLSGAVLIQLNSLPNATGSGTPPNSYGFIRFRAKVK